MTRERRIRSGEVELHVIEAGVEGRTPVLLLHGFPDDAGVYSHLMTELARDCHVVTYDMRGVGRSTAPKSPSGYRIDALLADVTAVIDAVFGPRSTAHILGHDWGSVIAFSYVAEGRDRARVRSFTSVSGPHVALMWSAGFRLAREGATRGGALRQLLASWYVLALNVPFLPELFFRLAGPSTYRRALMRGGVPASDPYLAVSARDVWSRTRHAIELYRQNALRPPPLPPPRSIDVPLCVLLPEDDPFVRPEVFTFLSEYATDLAVHRMAASHWVPRSHPHELAAAVRALVDRVDSQSTPSKEQRSCP